MNRSSIIFVNKDIEQYTVTLNKILTEIRALDEISSEIRSGLWNSNIKYRSSFDKSLTEFRLDYLERGRWVDFIFFYLKI